MLARGGVQQKWQVRSGIAMPVYSYATDDPLARIDEKGLYTAGPGCDTAPTQDQCMSAAQSIKSKCLRNCVEQRCADSEPIECESPDQEQFCNSNPGAAGQAATPQTGVCTGPLHKVVWCNPPPQCAAQAMVHELAHNCGWNHSPPGTNDGSGVPGSDGNLKCP